MLPKVSFTRVSENRKTGPIPITMTEASSCPSTCPLASVCYAAFGNVAAGWRAVPARGGSWADLCAKVKALPEGRLWRHNVAGDLPHTGGAIDAGMLADLARANVGRRGFAFTHRALTPANAAALLAANALGFAVNVSCETVEQADAARAIGLPVAMAVPTTAPKTFRTPEGHAVVRCPAVDNGAVQCASCGLCAKSTRKSIVAFPMHGARKRSGDKLLAEINR